MSSVIIPVELFDLVIFGGSGDLAKRKLLPALYRRFADGQMPVGSRIIGVSRSKYDTEEYRAEVKAALNKYLSAKELAEGKIEAFIDCVHYRFNDVMDEDGWDELIEVLADQPDRIRVFYLAVGPSLFGVIAQQLTRKGLSTEQSRLVVEKPLGVDYNSAVELNKQLGSEFDEKALYRIDHYLGKETVQNLMALRFANALFEPIWNCHTIDHVQITAAESIGVGTRGAYYDNAGAIRDMVQNHLLQLLCLIAMEPPYAYEADAIRDEKLKVLKSLRPLIGLEAIENTVRGQYSRGDDCHKADSYLDECGNPHSHTETYVAIKAEIDNWRWSGVPFYLRTGKRLKNALTEIAIFFKEPRHLVFGDDVMPHKAPNALIIRLQPNEGLELQMLTKEAGMGGFRLQPTRLDMTFAKDLGKEWHSADAYERLLMDVVRGNQTLFMRGDEVEAAWQWIDPIIEAWKLAGRPDQYEQGSVGPLSSLELMAKEHRRWRDIIID